MRKASFSLKRETILKSFLIFCVLALLLISPLSRYERYTVTFWGSFDTMFSITAEALSREEFERLTNAAIDMFAGLSRYYDRFNQYDKIINIADINNNSGQEIEVTKEIFDLLKFSVCAKELTEGAFDPLIGSVSELWRQSINDAQYGTAQPPSQSKLKKAGEIYKSAALILDESEKTVVVLRLFEDQKLDDIARILNENTSTVKTVLYRSLKKLKIRLTEGEMLYEG